jgi:cytoskeletal protein RodZ
VNTIDRYSLLDAAYVLGALSPAERRGFEEHLAGCSNCQAAVAELAGMPGLLGQVSPDDAALFAEQTSQAAEQEAPPKNLLPSRISEQRKRRRRLVATVVAAAVALILLAGGIAWNVGLLPVGEPRSPFLLAFSHVQPSSITATVEVVPQPEGTDFRVECQYGADGAHPKEAYDTYGIWIVDRSGSAVEAKTWPAKPNRVMRPEAHSPLQVSRIASVEIRDSAGQTLLRADLR